MISILGRCFNVERFKSTVQMVNGVTANVITIKQAILLSNYFVYIFIKIMKNYVIVILIIIVELWQH